MTSTRILLVCTEQNTTDVELRQILIPYGFEITTASDIFVIMQLLERAPPDLILLCIDQATPPLLQSITMLDTNVPLVAIIPEHRRRISRELLRVPVIDYLEYPSEPENVVAVVHRVLKKTAVSQDLRQMMAHQETSNQDLKRRVHDYEMLFKISRGLGALLDWNAVLGRITEAAVYLTGAEEGYLLLIDDVSGDLQLRAAQNLGDRQASNFKIKIDDSVAGAVIKTGKPVCLGGNVTKSYKVKTGLMVKSLVDVPLISYGKVIGVLGVDNQTSSTEFTPDHVRLMTQLANVASTVLENARQYSETRSKLKRRVRELELLQALTGQLGIITNFETGVQMTLSMLLKATGADGGLLHWVRTGHKDSLNISQGILDKGVLRNGETGNDARQWWSTELLSSVLSNGKPIIDNRYRDESFQPSPTSCMAIPLKHGKRIAGAVILESVDVEAFSADDVFFVRNIADYVTIALEAARLKERAQVNRTRLETVMAAVDNGVWVFDEKLKLIMQNQTAGKLVGANNGDLLGKTIDEILPPQDSSPNRLAALIRQAVKELQPIAFANNEFPVTGRTEPLVVAGRIVPTLRDDDLVSVICTLWKAQHSTENRYLETEFARMASHLFRTPISIIQSSIEVLLETDISDPDRAALLKTMRGQGQRLSDTTNELLKLVRMETEGVTIRAAPVAAYPIIERALDLVQYDNPYVTFEVKWDDAMPMFYADAAKTELILLNLLLNAMRRCAKGGHITISAHHRASEIVMAVEDTGNPLTKTQQERIFQRYYPVDDADGSLPATYNFGLYSIKNLVTLQRGKIWVESEPGSTTKFLFSLPIWEDVHVKNLSH